MKTMCARPLLTAALLMGLLALGSTHPVSAGPPDPVGRARAHLAQQADELGLRADLSDLSLLDVRGGLAGDYVRFQQTYGGVPLAGAAWLSPCPPTERTRHW